MKTKSVIIVSFFIAIFLGSCVDGKKKNTEGTEPLGDFVKVNVPNDYSLCVPRGMQKTTALNNDASLQYQNIHEEMYTIVIDEPKQEFVDATEELGYKEKPNMALYRNIQLQRLAERMHITHQSNPSSLTISGLNAESIEIDAKVDNIEEELSYFLTFIESENKIYMVMSWTLKSKKQDFKNTFLTIVKSFELSD